jgi:hypothetical protein
MPLDEFTKKEVEGLQRGGVHVPVGNAADDYATFGEEQKVARVLVTHARMKAEQRK